MPLSSPRPVFLRLLPLLLLIACGGNAPAASGVAAPDDCEDRGWSSRGVRACETRTYTLDANPLRIDATPNGGITVEAWDRNEIEVVARIDANAPTAQEARALLSQVQIETGASVRARTPESRDERWVSVSYTVRAPRDADLDLRTVNGGISVRDVTGSLHARAVNGGLDLQGIGGNVTAETTNGGVSLHLARGLVRGDRLDIETTNGGIEAILAGEVSADVDVQSSNGSIDIGRLPLRDVGCTARGRRAPGCLGGHAVGTLGKGGATVRLRTLNGPIDLSTR